jgi:heme exporter protein C
MTAVSTTTAGTTTASTNAAPAGTGTRGTRLLGVLALVGLAAVAVLGLLLSPRDINQGNAVRIMYVHVPSAWLAYLSFGVTALGSLMYLIPRTRSLTWDRIAGASAEIGVLFTGLALVTGMLWGQVTWGRFWTWDARLTSTALLFVLFLGYLAVRRLEAPFEVRAKRAAIVGIIAFIDVPIVHQSVNWWRTLHQKPTLLRRDPEIDGIMLFTLMLALVVFMVVYAWLLLHRFRIAEMEDALATREVDDAIERRQEERTPLDTAEAPS